MPETLAWSPDGVLPGFVAATLNFPPDYDGPVVATLVRNEPLLPSTRAVLYLHGFIDYFYQAHLAEAFTTRGYNFYALDLRKHGRSLRPGQHPNFCRDVREYYPEITTAIDTIAAEGHTFLLLNGHSTGGLTGALYAYEGPRRQYISALWLTSPFLDFNVTSLRRPLLTLLARIGRRLPFLAAPGAISPLYARSIHKDHYGEWMFDTSWKPIAGFPAYFGWLNAIEQAQRRVQRGLTIKHPVLVMHAERSFSGARWCDEYYNCDTVLNVEHMQRWGKKLGPQVNFIAISGGLHDLVLSRSEVRERVFEELFKWLG